MEDKYSEDVIIGPIANDIIYDVMGITRGIWRRAIKNIEIIFDFLVDGVYIENKLNTIKWLIIYIWRLDYGCS